MKDLPTIGVWRFEEQDPSTDERLQPVGTVSMVDGLGLCLCGMMWCRPAL